MQRVTWLYVCQGMIRFTVAGLLWVHNPDILAAVLIALAVQPLVDQWLIVPLLDRAPAWRGAPRLMA